MKTAFVGRRFWIVLGLAASVLGLARVTVADTIPNNGIPLVQYDPATGALTVNPDNAQLISILVEGPAASSITRWQNGTSSDGVTGWAQTYINSREQWVGAGGAVLGEFVTPVSNSYHIATYATGLTAEDFGEVEIGAHDPEGEAGLILFTNVTLDAPPTNVLDFNNDALVNVQDINLLTLAGNLVQGVPSDDPGYNDAFDLTGDQVINGGDIASWLQLAAAENGFTEPYLTGDTNLDGTVQFLDFQQIANNWQQTHTMDGSPVAWSNGDFNGDGIVQFLDFQQIANNWQQSIGMAAQTAAVPEPAGLALVGLGCLGLAIRRRR